MGAWGVGIFSNDTASDIREDFRDLVAEGLSAAAATDQLAAEYGLGKSQEDDNDFWLGLAVTQHRLGHVVPEVIQRALAIARDPAELERWQPTDRRRRQLTLEKLAGQLSQPPPIPKRLRRRVKADTSLEPGQHIVVPLGGNSALLRVTRIQEDKGGRSPHVVLVSWKGDERQLRKAHRLAEVSEPVPLRKEGEALGFILLGDVPAEMAYRLLDQRSDRRTPSQRWASAHVIKWSDLPHRLDGLPH